MTVRKGSSLGEMGPPRQANARVGEVECVLDVPPANGLRVDCLGRWSSARLRGRLYRRLLGGGVVVYDRAHVFPVEVSSPERVHGRIAELAQRLRQAILKDALLLRVGGSCPERERVVRYLALAGRWTAARYARQAQAFARAYPEPVEIVPPDRYQDVVVQPAVGCPNATCSFCAFYRGKRFRPLGRSELWTQLRAVTRLFGPGLGLRTGVFLGSASALSLSQPRLMDVLGQIRAVFGALRRGVAGFWDPDYSPRRTAADWQQLREAGLGCVYFGLETAYPRLRQDLGKSPQLEALHARVSLQRQSGMRTGIVVLAGCGGRSAAAAHRRATTAFVASLSLTPNDRVFVSPLEGVLLPCELARQAAQLRRELKRGTSAQVVPYAMKAFRYFA